MKQNLPLAKTSVRLGFLLTVLSLCFSACATLPRRDLHLVQSNTQAPDRDKVRPLNINVASASELEKLPGVGKIMAERIIKYREEYGPFRRAEHLMMVRGISDKKFREMRPMIVAE